MKVVLAGAFGKLGTDILRQLAAQGHTCLLYTSDAADEL